MKTDYPEFRNKRIEICGTKCLVVDCSYYAGVTVVEEADKENFAICLTRKEFSGNLGTYKRLFYSVVKTIQAGLVTPESCRSFFNRFDNDRFLGKIDNTKCAFQ